MSRTLHTLRASITVGAFLMTCGMVQTAQAADTGVQRVAMACTQGSDAVGCKPAAARHGVSHVATQARDLAPAKARKALPAAKSTVDYERDLWRHQSAS